MHEIPRIITALSAGEPLRHEDWLRLITDASEEDRRFSRDLACRLTQERFGRRVFFRGIIEFTNYCKNDCYYCGIRRSNRCLSRYRLTEDEILSCCEEGYHLGYRTFVLQGGEDGWWTDEKINALVRRVRAQYPDCAITLSIGEKSREAYQAFFDAGADRYLLRHETANEAHYAKLHPARQTLSNRIRCLRDLKDIGYQTGAGMMIGAPYQTAETLAQDMEFLADLRPEMVGMGPFLPHKDTPFRDFPHGSAELTLYLLSLVRLLLPDALLPATTALGTLDASGRQQGVLSGCNVVMPNLSPMAVRQKYLLYDNKAGVGDDGESSLHKLRAQMQQIGYEVAVGRGDYTVGRTKQGSKLRFTARAASENRRRCPISRQRSVKRGCA